MSIFGQLLFKATVVIERFKGSLPRLVEKSRPKPSMRVGTPGGLSCDASRKRPLLQVVMIFAQEELEVAMIKCPSVSSPPWPT